MTKLFKVFMSDNAIENAVRVLKSGWVGQGNEVEKFEKSLCHWFNCPHLITTNSATSALHLALHMVKTGEEVLTTPLTCTATNWPILANNLKIKWVDIDPYTLNIDIEDLNKKITDKTKIAIVVHWGGYPVDVDKIDKRLTVIEDCAHAMGSFYKGKHVGTSGNLSAFSFQAIKHITSIDGGCLITPTNLHKRAKLLRWYGIDRETNKIDFRCEDDIKEWGFKFHMNDVCATIGNENLKHIRVILDKHRKNAGRYDSEFSKLTDRLKIPKREEGFNSSFWIYSMLVEDRPNFIKWMKERGIVVSQVHERNDKHSCVSQFKTELPNLEKVIPKLVSIPVGWWLTEDEIENVVESVKKGW